MVQWSLGCGNDHQAIAEHYNTKLSNGDTPVQDRVKSLESDAELGPIFEDIKKNGLEVDW